MRRKNTTASILVKIRTDRANKFGLCPIIIRIAKDNEHAIRTVGAEATEAEWDEETQRPNKRHPKYLEVKKTIDAIVSRIEDKELEYRRKNEYYSVHDLTGLVSKEVSEESVFVCFDKIIKDLEDGGKIGTADTYINAKRFLESFSGNPNLKFRHINYSFLNNMLTYCRQRNHKETTMFFYFKTLRAFLNRCIKLDYCEPSDYGFKNFSLAQFNLKTRKRAISVEAMKKIEELSLEPFTGRWNTRNYFLFSFYTRGTNLIDIALLRRKNIVDGRLEYYRMKTGDFISVKLNEKALEIINLYRGLTHRDFLFPIFDSNHENENTEWKYMNRAQKARLNSLTSSISKRLSLIAKLCGLDVKLTFYVGRHSYASGLRKSGVGLSNIKAAMSHKDEKTTEIYLQEIENDTLDEFDNLLYSRLNNTI
jgi:integrase